MQFNHLIISYHGSNMPIYDSAKKKKKTIYENSDTLAGDKQTTSCFDENELTYLLGKRE